MVKRYNHQALTEAIRQGQARMKRTMTEEKDQVKPAESQKQAEKERVHIGIGTIPASRRKKPVRINRNYLVFAAVLIGLVLVIIWAGRSDSSQSGPDQLPAGETESVSQETTTAAPVSSRPTPQEPVRQPAVAPAPETRPQQPPRQPTTAPEKDHVIVIATYTKREHLLPAQEYFNTNGVRTEIMRRGSYYLLVTSSRFDSPLKSGTDGQQMLEKIKMLGRQYKAPDGYENFGRVPFQDAYGMKIKN